MAKAKITVECDCSANLAGFLCRIFKQYASEHGARNVEAKIDFEGTQKDEDFRPLFK